MSLKFNSTRAVTFDANSRKNFSGPFLRDRENIRSSLERNIYISALDDVSDQSFFEEKIGLCSMK